MLPTDSHLSLRRKDFLNTDLLNEVLTTQVNQMGSLLVVRQVRTDAVDHHHDESAIIHIKPIRTADEVIFTVPNEWTVKIDRQVGLIETCHFVGNFEAERLRRDEVIARSNWLGGLHH